MLFLRYIKQNLKIIAAFGLFSVVFAVVFALYGLPMGAVVYPVLLCAAIGLIFILVDFGKAKAKHRELDEMRRRTASMITELPDKLRIDDEDYQAIINSLKTEISALEAAANEKYRDTVDYYTTWAHQIKTPIASMRLNLQNSDTAGSRRLQADLFRIEQYVDMVLTFLRLNSETSDYLFGEYALDPIVRQAVKKFSHEFIGRKISLKYTPVDKTVVTDEKWLSFVLEQIISNALKYTDEGSISIYMTSRGTLCVEDTGIGIASRDLPRIFEKGYTGYNGRTDKKASGIGLYLCKRVCDNLGIGINVSSEVGRGTTVELDLEQYRIKKD